ncbi:glycosyl hydrolase [Sphingobium rhizovicinum]|uniref:Glycosyl hydrolase n=1 Tax=Sphingobium rhizovicinum TaxID=432308 RepID=A0ABV7NMQ3_9SPHN
MNGKVTKEGMDRDLDRMARMGIGGVQNFDASLMTP